MKENISYNPLIIKWEAYLQTNGDASLKKFANYLLQEDFSDEGGEILSNPTTETPESTLAALPVGPYLAGDAGEMISRLYKFSKQYSKSVLQDTGLTSLDEFAILATLMRQQESAKKNLIDENLIELTTGMDMLRRMIRQGLLIEQVNEQDKRQKLISLSEQGRAVLFQILEKFTALPDVLGDLSRTEREQLVSLLRRLDTYHTELRK